MTDKEFKAEQARLQKIIHKWVQPLGLLYWQRIKIAYERERGPEDDYTACEVAACASCAWYYKEAALTFFCSETITLDEDAAESVVVHELCHVLVNEMREWSPAAGMSEDEVRKAVRHEEHVVTNLAQAFIWVWKDGAQKLRRNK
jgi:hypothetical protein